MSASHSMLSGALQGLTEFLPISSSAHLILLPALTGWPDQGLAHDVAAHFGSLLAVIICLRDDLRKLLAGWVGSFSGRGGAEARLAWALIIATMPICVAGLLLRSAAAGPLRDPLVIASATMLFAVALWWADRRGERRRGLENFRLRDAALIGLFQVLAIIPGASRAGVTITAGLLLGLKREAASRFSLLLAIPVILLSSGYELAAVAASPAPADWPALFTVALVAFVSAYATVHFFLKLVERTGMLPYVIYRLVLGAVLFAVFL